MRHIFIMVFTVFFTNYTQAQTPEEILQKVQEKYTAEKIYIHYDKASYIAGETIWFKAYIIEGIYPSVKSTVLNVDLIDIQGKPIKKNILAVHAGSAIGSFELTDTLKEGNYTVRAYTPILMNFGNENYYYKNIQVYNPTGRVKPEVIEEVASVYFLPESGNLINNIKNTIAIKCTNQNGLPMEVSGKIIDTEGKEQLNFSSTHNGMGKFDFTPKSGQNYTAICTVNKTITKNIGLPKGIEEGVLLHIDKTKEKTYFLLDASTAINENLKPSYILGVQENVVIFKVPMQPDTKQKMGEIPINQLASGILQITVFNKNDKPLAERMIFVNNYDYLPKGLLLSDSIGLGAKEKNKFTYNFEDTLKGTFSVAVTQIDGEYKGEDNIISKFLLSSDIKGLVYEPTYYFENNDMIHAQNLDLVMLTNAWKRYSWNELLSNRFPSMAYKDPSYITLKGKAYNPVDGQVLISKELSITVKTKDGKFDVLSTNTDENGFFILEGMEFEDTAVFTFKSNYTKNKKVNVGILSNNLSNILVNTNMNLKNNYLLKSSIANTNKIDVTYNFNKEVKIKSILLNEIIIKSKLKSEKEKFESRYVSGRLGSTPNKEIDFLKEPTTSPLNVFDYVRSRINGLVVSGGPLDYQLNYRGARSLMGGAIPMNIFLDEFQVEASQIATLRIQDIALIKVFGASGLSGGPGGAIAIYTKRGSDGSGIYDVKQKTELAEGFTTTKEFFSPDYSIDNKDDFKADNRTTLYWNPYLNLSKDKKNFSFSFFNTDKPKKYKIVLEGIFEDGKLLHIEKIIE